MKTCRNLYPQLCSYENLELAFRKARKKKTTKQYVMDFESNLEENLNQLKHELETFTYSPSPLTTFTVRDPTPRTLTRLTTHSLRHYAITNFCRKNGGNVALASRFARHVNLQVTMGYIHTAKDELYESIERADNRKLLNRIRKLQEGI